MKDLCVMVVADQTVLTERKNTKWMWQLYLHVRGTANGYSEYLNLPFECIAEIELLTFLSYKLALENCPSQ